MRKVLGVALVLLGALPIPIAFALLIWAHHMFTVGINWPVMLPGVALWALLSVALTATGAYLILRRRQVGAARP